MKRLAALLLVCVLLVGCIPEPDGMGVALSLRESLLSGACAFDATVTADYGDYLHTFVIRCLGDETGTVEFSVLVPETISGITGSMDGKTGKLTFDDQVLAFSPLAEGELAPVTAPWVFLSSLRGGYIVSCAETGQGMLLTVDDSYAENALRLDIFLNEQNLPVSAEVIWRGRRILTMVIVNFRFV